MPKEIYIPGWNDPKSDLVGNILKANAELAGALDRLTITSPQLHALLNNESVLRVGGGKSEPSSIVPSGNGFVAILRAIPWLKLRVNDIPPEFPQPEFGDNDYLLVTEPK